MTRNSNAEPVVPGRISLQLRQGDRVVDSLSLAIRSSRLEITSRAVVEPGLAGAYAAPKGATRAPAIILLHGSEGGDTTSALIMARRFAARGYAAFAAIYVAYPWTGAQYPGIPTVFDSLPLERVDSARAWLGRQLEADTSRTSIWGGSKGAELALVVGSRRQWPSAIVACVPSDIVWAGFGRTAEPGKPLSSWSDRGERLAAVQYDRYEDVFNGNATSREVHDRSRRQNATEVAPARIPVEKIRAPLLLLGSERDEVWASGQMAREIARRKKSTLAYYEGAGHGICSDGMAPWETFGRGPDPDPRATARSAADAWRRTIAFLAQHAR